MNGCTLSIFTITNKYANSTWTTTGTDFYLVYVMIDCIRGLQGLGLFLHKCSRPSVISVQEFCYGAF